jgi:hypothetical protein
MFLPSLLYSTMLLVYSHIHIYTDQVEDLAVYKSLEKQLNEFGSKAVADDLSLKNDANSSSNLVAKRELWKSIGDHPAAFTSHNQDVVKQLMIGFGFRVTAARYPSLQDKITNDDADNDDGRSIIPTNTRSVLVTSRDPTGAKFIVTAIDNAHLNKKHHSEDSMHHFDAQRVQDYLAAHQNRQGIAVLAFQVDDLHSILDRYRKLHPKLVADHSIYENIDGKTKTQVLEVYAYYKEHDGGSSPEQRTPDTGTILRFVQVSRDDGDDNDHVDSDSINNVPLPGLIPVAAEFEASSMPAYSVRET